MPHRQLTLNQQIALLPATIPDSILDFLEDFGQSSALQTDSAQASFESTYLQKEGDALRLELDKVRAEMGKLLALEVEAAGKEWPGLFLLKLTFEKGARGLGVLTKVKERTIARLLVMNGAYDAAALKAEAAKLS